MWWVLSYRRYCGFCLPSMSKVQSFYRVEDLLLFFFWEMEFFGYDFAYWKVMVDWLKCNFWSSTYSKYVGLWYVGLWYVVIMVLLWVGIMVCRIMACTYYDREISNGQCLFFDFLSWHNLSIEVVQFELGPCVKSQIANNEILFFCLWWQISVLSCCILKGFCCHA